MRDIKVSLLAGLVVESILFGLDDSAKGELTGQHGWLEISQLPGAEVALRIVLSTGLRYSEHASFLAISFYFLIQWALYSAIALAVLHTYDAFKAGWRRGGH